MSKSQIATGGIADDAVTTAKVNPAQTDITSVGTLTSLAVANLTSALCSPVAGLKTLLTLLDSPENFFPLTK